MYRSTRGELFLVSVYRKRSLGLFSCESLCARRLSFLLRTARALNSSGRARGRRALSSLESAAPHPKRVLSGRARRVPASSERASLWVAFYISALVIEVCGLSSWF